MRLSMNKLQLVNGILRFNGLLIVNEDEAFDDELQNSRIERGRGNCECCGMEGYLNDWCDTCEQAHRIV